MNKPLRPRRHEAPAGWAPETFERVTDAVAAALVASYLQREETARRTAEES